METCDLQLQLFWFQSRKGRELKWYCCDQSPGSSSIRQYLDTISLQQRQYKKFPFCSSSLTAIFCTQLCKHLLEKCSKPDQSNDCVFKNKNNFTKGQQLPLIYLDPTGQMVWIMGNRQLHLWDQLQAVCVKLCIIRENQHGTWKTTLWLLSWSQRPCFWRAHKSVLSPTLLRCYNKLLDDAPMVQIKMPALCW